MPQPSRILPVAVTMFLLAGPAAADELETTDGRKFTGKIIEQTSGTIVFRVMFPTGGSAEVTFSRSEVKSLKEGPVEQPQPTPTPTTTPTPTPSASPTPTTTPTPTATHPPDTAAGPRPAGRTRPEIDALIDKAGNQQPEWWDDAKPNYPDTLELVWPDKGTKWDAQRHLPNYISDAINPNENRWQEGVRLLH